MSDVKTLFKINLYQILGKMYHVLIQTTLKNVGINILQLDIKRIEHCRSRQKPL